VEEPKVAREILAAGEPFEPAPLGRARAPDWPEA